MADISDDGAFDAALLRNNSDNFGPSAVVNQQLTAAQTAQAQAAASGQQIQNQNARLQYLLFRQGMQHLADFSGQGGPTLSDQSGAATQSNGTTQSNGATQSNAPSSTRGGINDSTGISAAPTAPPGSQPAASNSSAPDDVDVGESAADQARVQASTEQRYNVDPAGTPEEMQAVLQAHQYAVRMKLSGNKGLADAAEEQVQMMKDARDMAVIRRKNAAKLDASESYDKLAAVESAPEGQAFDTMEAVFPQSAEKIKKEHPDASPEKLDEIVRDTVMHYGAFIHRFSDREVMTGDDGATYDKQTGMRVDGVPIRGVTAERQAELLKQANNIVTTKNSDGTETTSPQYVRDGYKNPNAWVTDAVAQIRSRNSAINTVEAVGNHAAQYGHIVAGAPPIPGGTLYRGPQPGQPQQPGQQPSAPGAAPQPGAQQPGQQPQRPAALPGKFGDDSYTITSLQDKDYRLNTPPVKQGTSQSPAALEESKNVTAAKNELIKKSNEDISSASQAQAYLTAAQRIMASKGAPATGLPGSIVNQISRLYGGIDATNYQEVAKYLGNAALQGAKQTYGARMTQKEVDLQLHELSPSTAMTPDAINNLLVQMKKNAQYAIAAGSHAKKYLAAGNDPRQYEDYLNHYYPRDEFVNGSGQTPPTRPGQQSSGGQQGSAPRSIVRTGTINGRKVVQYSDGSTAYAE
jgi:hypothetical protein